MASYLLKILGLVLFSFLVIFFYYGKGSAHIENFNGYMAYIIVVGMIYAIYKYISSLLFKEKVRFSLSGILSLFLLHLFVLSSLFFYYNNIAVGQGFVLFFKILIFSILPVSIVFISIGFGRKLFKLIGLDPESSSGGQSKNLGGQSKNLGGQSKNLGGQSDNKIFTFLVSLGLGFFSFVTILSTIGILGFYNLYIVFAILIGFILYSYKELGELWEGFLNYRVEFENHDLNSDSFIKNIALKLLSTEFLFIVATLILSISLISIMRPMPIGWDDLGVYMNFPRQLAYAGEVIALGGMYSWQVFTGIGYMIGEPNQAFFLNNVGGILSFIVLILVTSDLLKSKKETFINIPLLIATVYISLPMVVFQQAKDMKLDQGLFFISVIVIYIVFKVFKKSEAGSVFGKILSKVGIKNKEDIGNSLNYVLDNDDFLTDKKLTFKILFVVGILAGFAFSIKFTSLLLISAIIGVLFYTEIGFAGFMGFLGLFFAIFTKFSLWSYMNISYDKTDTAFINIFSLVSFIIGFVFLTIGFLRHKKEVTKLFVNILVFVLGILIALSPWLAKNLSESAGSISMNVMLKGKVERLVVDYEKIHSAEKIEEIKNTLALSRQLTESGTTTHEDFGRYFGYEKGINNYVKLPWNLTMQLNQGGEFTTIGFLFLALIPSLFLFLPYRKKGLELVIVGFLLLQILLYVIPSSRAFITGIFEEITLPGGYLYILALFFAPLIFLLFSLKNTVKNNLFKINLVFAVFYIFLWSIAAFGIVWYGIVMYFCLLLMIAIGLHNISSYKLDESDKKKIIKFFGTIIAFTVFLIWFLFSVFPHSFNNLKNAGYPYYKQSKMTANELVFAYHTDYLKILLSLNINKDKRENFLLSKISDEQLKTMAKPYVGDITVLDNFLKVVENGDFNRIFIKDVLSKIDKNTLKNLQNEARNSKLAIYELLLKPEEEFKNIVGIYKIGTFLSYFIIDNKKRIFTDNLINKFDKYIYDEDIDLTVERMKKLGLGYLLVDLNAATIDKDPRHDLTRRYENLLKTFTSDKLNLIETDSLCLKFGLERYSKSEKTKDDFDEYLILAGVNFESYPEDSKVIKRGDKQLYCYSRVLEAVKENKVVDDNYVYLQTIKNYLATNAKDLNTEQKILKYLSSVLRHGSKVLFEIK